MSSRRSISCNNRQILCDWVYQAVLICIKLEEEKKWHGVPWLFVRYKRDQESRFIFNHNIISISFVHFINANGINNRFDSVAYQDNLSYSVSHSQRDNTVYYISLSDFPSSAGVWPQLVYIDVADMASTPHKHTHTCTASSSHYVISTRSANNLNWMKIAWHIVF